MDGRLQALILGVLQGATEFLPVSSSGHLALVQQWLGDDFLFLKDAVLFDLVLHIGTLIPVFWFYREDLKLILARTFTGIPWRSPGQVGMWLKGDYHRWLAFLVCVATVPTAIIGLTLKDTFEGLFHNTTAVCVALFITGCLLYTTRFFGAGNTGRRSLTIGLALLIGLAQGIAITPGISRSGTTIAVALLLGLERELAARFSFLMSIPAIVGAIVLMGRKGMEFPEGSGPALFIGFFAALVVGYVALRALVALVRLGGFYKFSYYLWPVAVVGYFMLG